MNAHGRNTAIFIGVAAVHACAIIAVMSARSPVPETEEQFISALFFIDEARKTKRINDVQPRVTQATRKKLAADNSANSPTSAPTSSAPVAMPAVDWSEQAGQVAKDIASRATTDSTRSLSSTPRTIELPSNAKMLDGLFVAPIHKNGDTQSLGGGELITWINNKCYATNRDDGPLRQDPNSVVVVCKGNVGKPKPRIHLFDAAKPRNLRNSDLPEPIVKDNQLTNPTP